MESVFFVQATLSTTPLRWVCTWEPPSSSFDMSRPSAAFTTGGPPGNSCAVPRTMTLKWARQALMAGRPATDPSTAAATGTALQELDVVAGPGIAVGQVRPPHIGKRGHAAAGGIEQADIRNTPLQRPAGGAQLLAHAARISAAGAAADGEVARHHNGLPPGQLDKPGDLILRGKAGEPVVFIMARSGQQAELAETAVVSQHADALTRGQFPVLVLAPDLVRAAHLQGQLAALRQLREFVFAPHKTSGRGR